MKVRKALIILLIAVLALFAGSTGLAATSGDDETDIVDITKDTSITKAQPGQNNVVVQAVMVADPGDRGDENKDGFDTAIETVTVKRVSGSTLEDRFVRKVKLYLDDNNKGTFEPDKDFLLGEVSNPDLTAGVTFGTPGDLLTDVEDGRKAIFFVVMDFADDAPDGATLRTSFDLTVSDSLVGGPTISSGLDPAAFPPVLRGSGDPEYFFLRITSTTGDDETDIIDETPSTTATPGDLVVLQQFTIADPGPTGDADKDGKPTLVRNITVKKASGTVDTTRILKLMLYKEKATTPPGFQQEDELLSVVVNPNLDAGVVFHNNGRRLLRVADESEERLYIVAQLAPVGFNDGDTIQTEVSVVAKDDPAGPGAEASSGIETPMPVLASNFVTIEVPPPTIIISSAELKPTEQGTVTISVRYIPEPGLGEFQLGPLGALVYDPDVLEVTGIHGVSPYRLETYDLSIPGLIYFVLALKPGRKPINEGPVIELTVRPAEGVEPDAETMLDIEDDMGLETVDAFKDVNGKDLVPDIIPGTVKIRLVEGDIDGDNIVTVSDARIVARYILGLERLTPEQIRAADVAPPKGMIDVTDVRYIAQAAAGLRELDPAGVTSLTLGTRDLKPGSNLLKGLLHFLGIRHLSPAHSQLTVTTIGKSQLAVAFAGGTSPVDIQGVLTFDPTAMQVRKVVGLNGYTVLASKVDNNSGKVRFVATSITGSPISAGKVLLNFELTDKPDNNTLKLYFDFLRDAQGRELTAALSYSSVVAPSVKPRLVHTLAYRNGRKMKFTVQGAGSESIKVQVFNLAGAQVFDSGFVRGDTLEWHLTDNQGHTLANGVYLYVITVKDSSGKNLKSEVRKLVLSK